MFIHTPFSVVMRSASELHVWKTFTCMNAEIGKVISWSLYIQQAEGLVIIQVSAGALTHGMWFSEVLIPQFGLYYWHPLLILNNLWCRKSIYEHMCYSIISIYSVLIKIIKYVVVFHERLILQLIVCRMVWFC